MTNAMHRTIVDLCTRQCSLYCMAEASKHINENMPACSSMGEIKTAFPLDQKQNIISELRNHLNFGKEIVLEKQVESLKFEEDAKNYESTLSEKQSEIERLQVEESTV